MLFLFETLMTRNIFKVLFMYRKQKFFLLLKTKGGKDKIIYRGRYLLYYLNTVPPPSDRTEYIGFLMISFVINLVLDERRKPIVSDFLLNKSI